MDRVSTDLVETDLVIAGERRTTKERLPVTNPATGEIFATVASATKADVDDAFAAARSAQSDWAALSFDERAAYLQRVAERLAEHTDELALILTQEQGKPLKNARAEIDTFGRWLASMSELSLEPETLVDDGEQIVELRRVPIGVIAAITPWNVPIGLAIWKIVPALLAGNTMVLKPSPFTPVATARLGELVADILPAGVLTVVTGGDDIGAAMTAHPTPDKVTMTGSVATGKRVALAAAETLKRVTLELGGNDPAIVLEGADVQALAPRLFYCAFANNGQVCTAIKRIYAHESVAEELAQNLARLASAAVVGDGTTEGVQFGPLATSDQRDRVEALVDEAVAQGARVVTGGKRIDGPGFFYEPTIVTDVPAGTALELEEQFGPALPVLQFTSIDDAVARANDSSFGLGASVWGQEQDAAAVADRLEAGTVWVNNHMVLSAQYPFGGHKHSGIGVENGLLGLQEYTRVRVVHRPKQRS